MIALARTCQAEYVPFAPCHQTQPCDRSRWPLVRDAEHEEGLSSNTTRPAFSTPQPSDSLARFHLLAHKINELNVWDCDEKPRRMLKRAVQQGRSKQKGDAYSFSTWSL